MSNFMWVAFSVSNFFNEEAFIDQEMFGVRGVSETYYETVEATQGHTLGVLKMPRSGFVKANPKARQIDYSTNGMLADNWKWFARVIEYAPGGWLDEEDLAHEFDNHISPKMQASECREMLRSYFYMKNAIDSRDYHRLDVDSGTGELLKWITAHPVGSSIAEVCKSLSDYMVSKGVLRKDIDISTLQEAVDQFIQEEVESYRTESEWDTDYNLRIPNGSTLYVSRGAKINPRTVAAECPWMSVRVLKGVHWPLKEEDLDDSSKSVK